MEIWDGYNEKEEKVGVNLIRGEKIPKGVFHVVVVIVVQHEDGSYLLMQRDFNKGVCPGKWEAGASGCLQRGEDFEEGAKRELFEETGVRGNNIKLVDTYINLDFQTIYKIYLKKTKINKNEIILQRGETINFRWVLQKELLQIIYSSDFVSPSKERMEKLIRDNQFR